MHRHEDQRQQVCIYIADRISKEETRGRCNGKKKGGLYVNVMHARNIARACFAVNLDGYA